METAQWRDCLGNAIRYWEPRRILYNLLLAAIVAIHFVKGPCSRTSHIAQPMCLMSLPRCRACAIPGCATGGRCLWSAWHSQAY